MTEAQDPYAYWRAALQAKSKRDLPPTSDGDVHCGRYRMRKHKDGPLVPVAVWPVEGQDHACMIDDKHVDHETAQAKASFFQANPVTQAQFTEFMETGRWWDEVGAPIGHNNPPEDGEQDDHARLQAEFEALKKEAEPLLGAKVETQDQAEKHAAVAKALDGLANKAEKLRKAEKQPHLDAGKAVDNKWRDLANDPKAEAKKVKRTLDEYIREQDRIKREEADRLRREAMEQAKRSDDQDSVVQKMAEAQALDSQKTAIGTSGVKVRMRTVVDAVITDYDAAFMALKDRQEMKELVQSLANRAVRSGVDLPGVQRHEREEAA